MQHCTITLRACPRCNGAVIDYGYTYADNPLCVTCGWRRAEVSADVLAEVRSHLGKPLIENRYLENQMRGRRAPPREEWDDQSTGGRSGTPTVALGEAAVALGPDTGHSVSVTDLP